jgi:hypothetical protein
MNSRLRWQRMDLAGDKVDACQQADDAVALIFMLAREGRMKNQEPSMHDQHGVIWGRGRRARPY